MFAARYFPKRHFAGRYFAKPISSGSNADLSEVLAVIAALEEAIAAIATDVTAIKNRQTSQMV